MEDLTGQKFGHLKVIGAKESGKKRRSWVCECDCGNVIVMSEHRLLGSPNRRPNKSCGCKQYAQNGYATKYPRLHSIWHQMISRCYRKENDNYDRYGGKGITVCKEWQGTSKKFCDWALNNGYKEGLTVDRIDPKKPYSPKNCRWVDYYTQAQNKGVSKRNKTGYTGVCNHYSGKYRAYITRDGKRSNLGLFDTIEEAAKARKDAEKRYELYGEV